MNDEFYSAAFSRNEQKKIYEATIKVELGKDTKDKVFLLSASEALQYFDTNKAMLCGATAFTQALGNFTYAYCSWWLRSTSSYDIINAPYVDDGGNIDDRGHFVNNTHGVRPAMWISPEPIPQAPSADTRPGDYVVFGSYEQDNDTSNGKEPIEWLVLSKKDGRILVISKYVLTYQKFHNNGLTDENGVTWEACSLHKWLNKDFLNKAFTADEQKKIPKTTIKAETGKDTKDKVFLLSISEAKKYFGYDLARRCKTTAYAWAHKGNAASVWWWLRSPGNDGGLAARVGYDGRIEEWGRGTDRIGGVRPAMWINIGS